MAAAKEIRTKIGSVKSTQKITKAMELVAASKMRKSQELMTASKPYAQKIRTVTSHLACASTDYAHDYMTERPHKKSGYIVVSSDRGLCGGLNINLFKQVITHSKALKDQGISAELCLLGNKATAFFSSVGGEVVASVSGLGDSPSIEQLLGAVKIMLDGFISGRIDKLFIVHNEFVNTMTQQPKIVQLLPLEPTSDTQSGSNQGNKLAASKEDGRIMAYNWDYIYEPNIQEVLDQLMVRYIESQVYQGVIENNACEQAARMVAMKAATDNAGGMINDLQLIYNKARQAAITQELAEIVGGAAAV